MGRASHLKWTVSGVAISAETVPSAACSADFGGFFILGGPEDPVGLDQWTAVVLVEWTDAGAFVVAPGVDQSIIGVHVSTGSSGWCELVRFLPRGRYSYFDGARLRRYARFKAAHLAYERESVGTSNFLPGATLRW